MPDVMAPCSEACNGHMNCLMHVPLQHRLETSDDHALIAPQVQGILVLLLHRVEPRGEEHLARMA